MEYLHQRELTVHVVVCLHIHVANYMAVGAQAIATWGEKPRCYSKTQEYM